jgi:hypothetical protein
MAFEKLSPLLKQKASIKEIRSVDRKVLRPVPSDHLSCSFSSEGGEGG